MARWRLLEGHYIHAKRDGVGCEWVYKEINRANGREIQKKYAVPMYLDPRVESDWTHQPGTLAEYPSDGAIIVALEGTKDQRDVIIEAKSVTPGMAPLDDEARAISARLNAQIIPIEGREDATYSERLLDKFIEQMAEVQSRATQQTDVAGIGDVLKAMTAMMEQNQKILTALVESKADRRRA